jgi:hypothetical protein
MGRTACTVASVELHLYSPFGPYGLYRASVPVQGVTFTFTFTKERNGFIPPARGLKKFYSFL